MKSLLLLFMLCSVATAQVPQSKHIWIVAEENHSYESIVGNASLPYYNSLISKYGLATQYYSPMHNSLAALFWLVAGKTVTVDNSTTSCFDVDNVVREVLAKGLTWRSYQVDLPYAGFQGLFNIKYMRRHNPLIDFTDACAPNQQLNSVPYAQLALDVANETTANYVYITPDADEDAHDGTLEQADVWLASNVPAILDLPEFQRGGDGILFVVWDEGDLSTDNRCSSRISSGCGGRLATLVIGPQVKPGFKSSVLYTHANLLRTVCDAMSFSSCPGEGAFASPMSDFFETVGISTPPADAHVAPDVRVQASGSSSSPVYAMQLYADDTLKYQTAGSTIDTTLSLSSGPHHVVAQSWDKAGGIHKSALDLTVQNEAVVINEPAANAIVASPVHIGASAGGKSTVRSMQIYVDDSLDYEASSNSISASLPMSAGGHHVVVQAWDNSGGITKAGIYVTVATPSISLVAPAANAGVYSPVQILSAAQDPNGLQAVQAYVDGTLHYEMTGDGIAMPIPIGVGAHQLVVKAWNNLGQSYAKSININVLPIVVTINSPSSNSKVSSPVEVRASAPADSTVFTMQVYVDDALKYQTGGTSVDVSLPMSSGQHNIVAQAWDTGGGTYKANVVVTVP